jgi:hypothetical protein
MRHVLFIAILAAITYMAWRDRQKVAVTLEDEWTAFLRELGL